MLEIDDAKEDTKFLPTITPARVVLAEVVTVNPCGLITILLLLIERGGIILNNENLGLTILLNPPLMSASFLIMSKKLKFTTFNLLILQPLKVYNNHPKVITVFRLRVLVS
ncbi:hypothetical protein RIVM261_081880 [Rivularia sp. IAM M-261]|nr:hypothetical protein RIVM261_081880 [Rivularia sp. IAM M-261]